MTSRGPVVEAEVDDVTAAVVEPEVDDVTAAALESMSQSCLLSKVVGASPPLLTSLPDVVAVLGLHVSVTI